MGRARRKTSLRRRLAAVGDSSPITDMRGGAEYRRDMVNTLVKRTLLKAFNDARDMKGGNA